MNHRSSLKRATLGPALAALKRANAAVLRAYPGEPEGRQPVHTVYGGAHLFKADSAPKLGALALKALHQYAPDPASFAAALGLPEKIARTVHQRVADKLRREPVEDFRIDFEDGYGHRGDEEEDHHAVAAADEVARGLVDKSLPPFIGIRIKTLSNELHERSLRTLDLFVTALCSGGRRPPEPFFVTLPKIAHAGQVALLAKVLGLLERKNRLASGALKIELMVETVQSLVARDGRGALLGLVEAAGGRCTGAHFGTYDYTAGCSITAHHQRMDHPACDHAKHAMQVALAGTGVALSDGATNVMPVGAHRPEPGGTLTSEEIHENVLAVHKAWRLHFDHARHSLEGGFYQGWDLHPAQLPSRYAAVYSFFLEGLPAASARLKNFVEKAAQATLVGDVFDDAATGQGLLNYFLRGLACGAVTEEEARATGLSRDELRTRSFLKILEMRRRRKP